MPEADGTTPTAEETAAAAVAATAAEDAATAAAGTTEGGRTLTAEESAAEIKRLNAESYGRRKKIEEYEAAEAKRQRDGLTELDAEKAKVTEAEKRATDLEAKLAARELRDEVADAAGKLGFRNPALAGRLVDLSAVTDDDGKVDRAKIDRALKDALKADPYLGGAAGGDGGARTHGPAAGEQTNMNSLIRKGAGVER